MITKKFGDLLTAPEPIILVPTDANYTDNKILKQFLLKYNIPARLPINNNIADSIGGLIFPYRTPIEVTTPNLHKQLILACILKSPTLKDPVTNFVKILTQINQAYKDSNMPIASPWILRGLLGEEVVEKMLNDFAPNVNFVLYDKEPEELEIHAS